MKVQHSPGHRIIRESESDVQPQAVLTRFSRLAKLDLADRAALSGTLLMTRSVRARRDAVVEGGQPGHPWILTSGWAALCRILMDGRRQVLDLVLPGELIACRAKRGLPSLTTVTAVTDIALSPLAAVQQYGDGISEALSLSGALSEYYLLRHIARLGRLNAYERLADWLLEIHERLTLNGLAEGGEFPFPITQELLADVLGMTGVHVNRTLQALRHDKLIEIRRGRAAILDIAALSAIVDFQPASRIFMYEIVQ